MAFGRCSLATGRTGFTRSSAPSVLTRGATLRIRRPATAQRWCCRTPTRRRGMRITACAPTGHEREASSPTGDLLRVARGTQRVARLHAGRTARGDRGHWDSGGAAVAGAGSGQSFSVAGELREQSAAAWVRRPIVLGRLGRPLFPVVLWGDQQRGALLVRDRKSTRLNSSHLG